MLITSSIRRNTSAWNISQIYTGVIWKELGEWDDWTLNEYSVIFMDYKFVINTT